MQLIQHLSTLLLCATGIWAIPSGYNTPPQQIEERVGTTTATSETVIDPELKYWNSVSGVPTGGLEKGLYLFQGTLPRDNSGDSSLPALIVEGMNAVNANHHYLISISVTEDTVTKTKVTTRKAAVAAWDIAVEGTDTMVLSKSATNWKRAKAPTVTYKYLKKAKSDKTANISKKGTHSRYYTIST